MRITLLATALLGTFLAYPVMAVENLPPAVVAYLNKQGPLVSSSFFRAKHPSPQMAVYYCVDEALPGGMNEGANNPSFSHCSVALFNRGRHGKWFFGNDVGIGQGLISEFHNGMIFGESVEYGDNDALCCPSKRTPIRLNTSTGKLARVIEEPEL